MPAVAIEPPGDDKHRAGEQRERRSASGEPADGARDAIGWERAVAIDDDVEPDSQAATGSGRRRRGRRCSFMPLRRTMWPWS